MLVRMAAMALTWSDLERSTFRTRIFQSAVTWKRLQIGPWLPLKLNRKSLMLFQRAPVAVTWSDLAQHRYLKVSSLQKSKLQPRGPCIYYRTLQSWMKRYTGFSMRHLRFDPALGIWSVQQRIRSLAYI